MNRPNDLVSLPPLARTVIYYVLALSIGVVSALVGYGVLDPVVLVILGNVAAVFFGVAGSNVAAKQSNAEVLVSDVVLEPLPSGRP